MQNMSKIGPVVPKLFADKKEQTDIVIKSGGPPCQHGGIMITLFCCKTPVTTSFNRVSYRSLTASRHELDLHWMFIGLQYWNTMLSHHCMHVQKQYCYNVII